MACTLTGIISWSKVTKNLPSKSQIFSSFCGRKFCNSNLPWSKILQLDPPPSARKKCQCIQCLSSLKLLQSIPELNKNQTLNTKNFAFCSFISYTTKVLNVQNTFESYFQTSPKESFKNLLALSKQFWARIQDKVI